MTVKINFEGTSNECKQLTLKIAKAKELLRRLKVERDELSERCKMFEKSEEIKNVGKNSLQMQEIGCVIGYSNDISSAPHMGENKTSVKNVFTENMCENKGEMENSERNYLQIQQTTTVISPLNDASSPSSTEHQITPVDTVVIESMSENKETGNFESSNSQIHEASSVIPSLNDVFFPSAKAPKIIPNESALVLNTSENEVDFENIPPKRRKRDIAQIDTHLFKKLTTLQKDKVDLENKLESLEFKLSEKQLKEKMYLKENTSVNLSCKELEEKLFKFQKMELEMKVVLDDKQDLEMQVASLKQENDTFQQVLKELNHKLSQEIISKEEKMCDEVGKKYSDDINGERLILDLVNKSKEIVFLKEKIRLQQEKYNNLNNKLGSIEEGKEKSLKKLNFCKESMEKLQNDLEISWREHQVTKNELGEIKKELMLTQLHKQQLELCNKRLAQMADLQIDISPAYEMLVQEVEALRCGSAGDINSADMEEIQNKLQFVLSHKTQLEALLDKLDNQQQQLITSLQQGAGQDEMEKWKTDLDRQQTDLMTELRAYREQHTSLAELIGSTGILQESLYRHKQLLLNKLQERTDIEEELERQRSELKTAQLKIQMMEHQMLEKDRIQQELNCQKRQLEQELCEIEDRLRDHEDKLETQRLNLQAEIQTRDLHIRHWQLQLNNKQVEMNTEAVMKTLEEPQSAENHEQRLELLRTQLDELHLQAVTRLRHHLEQQFSTREAEIQHKLSVEISTLKNEHSQQLEEMRQELDRRVKEIEQLVGTELFKQLGITHNMAVRIHAEDLTNIKEKQEAELEEIKLALDEEIYTRLRHKFEQFSQQQISLAITVLQEEERRVHEQEISSLLSKHKQELAVLQSNMETQSLHDISILIQ
ncbi:hypothetical protein L9F63_027547, partial [Diploptera punctata]